MAWYQLVDKGKDGVVPILVIDKNDNNFTAEKYFGQDVIDKLKNL